MKNWGYLSLAFCLFASAIHAGDVFDDCIFWFRGGKVSHGNGVLETGEFWDAIHANDARHANHGLQVFGYEEGRQIRTENVLMPGTGETVSTPVLEVPRVLRISEDGHATNYFHGVVFTQPIVKQLGPEFTWLFRIRRDFNELLPDGNCWLAKIGYTGKAGVLIGFTGSETNVVGNHVGKQVIVYRVRWTDETRTASSLKNWTSSASMRCPTNTWLDVSVTASGGVMRVGLIRPSAQSVVNNASGSGKSSYPPVLFEALDYADVAMTNAFTHAIVTGTGSKSALFVEASPNTEVVGAVTNKSMTQFTGALQQLAVWNRALSDEEIREACGRPGGDLWHIGLRNGTQNEFGGVRTGAAQTFTAGRPFDENTPEMAAGDVWTVNFPVRAAEAKLAQRFWFQSAAGSSPADLRVAVNGKAIRARTVLPGEVQSWFVPTNVLVSGNNALTLTRTDARTESVVLEAMGLGGSWQMGAFNSNNSDLTAETFGVGTFFRQMTSQDANPLHWCRALTTYNDASNLVARFWVDSLLVQRCMSRLVFRTTRASRSLVPTMAEGYGVCVNGVAREFLLNGEETLSAMDERTGWQEVSLAFGPGELEEGWNELRVNAFPSQSSYWMVDGYRFELLSMPSGTLFLLR